MADDPPKGCPTLAAKVVFHLNQLIMAWCAYAGSRHVQ